jgi:hypothetical protein
VNRNDTITRLEAKIVALGKAKDEIARELEHLKRKTDSAPRTRKNLKVNRMAAISAMYNKRKITLKNTS